MSHAIELAQADAAPLGRGDATRRWALRFPDGVERFAGLTRPEARGLASALEADERDGWSTTLAEVGLPALLTDGAGPHLLDDAGTLVIVLGAHPSLDGALVAMGEPQPEHRIGLVARREGGVWTWLCDARVAPDRRVDALDALAAFDDLDGGAAWTRTFGGPG